MDRIDGMKTFVAAVEAGSFTAAAERVGISNKLVSKYVAVLEKQLKVRLLHRTTRQLSTTEAGQNYYTGCVRLLAELNSLESGLTEQSGLSGSLKVAVPRDYGIEYVLPLVQQFQKTHPEVIVDIKLSDSYVDLAADGFDVAIRLGDFVDSSLVTRKIGTSEIWVVASSSLAETLNLVNPQDLSRVPCLQDTNARDSHIWPIGNKGGVKITANTKINSALAIRQLALDGCGVAILPDFFAKREVVAGRLIRLFPDYPTRIFDIRIIYLSSAQMPARQRAFIDFIYAGLKRTL